MRHFLGFWLGFAMKGFKEQRTVFVRNIGNYGLFLMTAFVIYVDYSMVGLLLTLSGCQNPQSTQKDDRDSSNCEHH